LRGSFLGALYSGVVGSDGLGTDAVGVSPVESDEVFVGLGDVDEHAGQELERIGELGTVERVSRFGLIDE
jgi:hypothetical protein